MELPKSIEPDARPLHEPTQSNETKPIAWYACIVAMWACLILSVICVSEARPREVWQLTHERALENAARIRLGLSPLPSGPSKTPWDPLLVAGAANALGCAIIFGGLAAIVRRVDEMARKAA